MQSLGYKIQFIVHEYRLLYLILFTLSIIILGRSKDGTDDTLSPTKYFNKYKKDLSMLNDLINGDFKKMSDEEINEAFKQVGREMIKVQK